MLKYVSNTFVFEMAINTMLHRFAFSNFQSFRERTEVNWLLDGKVPEAVWSSRSASGERASTVMALIGANASGKTGLLSALVFLRWFISDSFSLKPDMPLPFEPHALAGVNESSEFELEGEWGGKLWRYVLSCTRAGVVSEALYEKHERMRYVFVRTWNESKQDYDVKQRGFGMSPTEARKVRRNASLLATAAQYGLELAIEWSRQQAWTNLSVWDVPSRWSSLYAAAGHFATEDEHKRLAVNLLSKWDMGLEDVELLQVSSVESRDPLWWPQGVHTSKGRRFLLSFERESQGTQSAFVLLHRLLPALKAGGLAVIDEFENDLHPHMLEPILSLFADSRTNPHGAQLLFTCHAIEVLNILHKSQVMLVEKDEHNESTAWRLDSVEGIRSDDNFYAKYMAGAYGAVPQL